MSSITFISTYLGQHYPGWKREDGVTITKDRRVVAQFATKGRKRVLLMTQKELTNFKNADAAQRIDEKLAGK